MNVIAVPFNPLNACIHNCVLLLGRKADWKCVQNSVIGINAMMRGNDYSVRRIALIEGEALLSGIQGSILSIESSFKLTAATGQTYAEL